MEVLFEKCFGPFVSVSDNLSAVIQQMMNQPETCDWSHEIGEVKVYGYAKERKKEREREVGSNTASNKKTRAELMG